jgi:3-isopropylmalate/(R)-2-methylmalate dehydratase small subunit
VSDALVRLREHRGTAIVVRGDDIDTDVIMPARFLKAVSFAGLEEHVFRDVRFGPEGQAKGHPFDRPEFSGASVLVAGANFGCGSSREHAPQGLKRWGIRAIVAESYSEIFFGNCVQIGLPAVTADPADVGRLMDSIELDPSQEIEIDLETLRATWPGGSIAIQMPEAARARLMDGTWDAMRLLLSAQEQIHATADSLPYIRGF